VELVYEDSHVMLSRRPRTYQELLALVVKMTSEAQSEQDVVMEYASPTGVKSIANDISLQEAYAVTQTTIIGIRLARDYVPFEVRQRGSSYNSYSE
jgi:hypothetical protein